MRLQEVSEDLSRSDHFHGTSREYAGCKTVSGMAMASAAALDSLNIIGMVGTIAGDDTIMCVMKDKNIGRTAIAEIDHMIKKLKE